MLKTIFFISFSLCFVVISALTTLRAFDYQNQPDDFWEKVLEPPVLNICRAKGTEPSGSGIYDDFYKDGKYYCACCGGDYPLFDSTTKYDSKTGWPSFWEPIDEKHVRLLEGKGWFGSVIEVRCARCDSHLGDLFNDGPKPTGKRYCINSLALVFSPRLESPVRTYAEPEVAHE